jgi:hypothetical protein
MIHYPGIHNTHPKKINNVTIFDYIPISVLFAIPKIITKILAAQL